MGQPELMSTKSTSVLLLMSSAHLVIVSGKQPSTCRHNSRLYNFYCLHPLAKKTHTQSLHIVFLIIFLHFFLKGTATDFIQHNTDENGVLCKLFNNLEEFQIVLDSCYWGCYLNTKEIFSFVPLQQGPLRLLALQQVRAHGHLPAGDVSTEALAHTPER